MFVCLEKLNLAQNYKEILRLQKLLLTFFRKRLRFSQLFRRHRSLNSHQPHSAMTRRAVEHRTVSIRTAQKSPKASDTPSEGFGLVVRRLRTKIRSLWGRKRSQRIGFWQVHSRTSGGAVLGAASADGKVGFLPGYLACCGEGYLVYADVVAGLPQSGKHLLAHRAQALGVALLGEQHHGLA